MISIIRRGIVVAAVGLTTAVGAAELETDEARLGYIIGMDIGKSLRDQQTAVDLDAMFEAIRTVYEGGEPALTSEEAQAIREAYMAERQDKAAAEQAAAAVRNRLESQQFLEQNAREEGVQVTDSGLQYRVVEMGEGERPGPGDTVTVHYRGTLLDGTEFDSSYAREEPISFALDRVISGWTEGLQLMPEGSTFIFYIKPELAYGESGGGPIPPNATLIFEVELLDFESGTD